MTVKNFAKGDVLFFFTYFQFTTFVFILFKFEWQAS